MLLSNQRIISFLTLFPDPFRLTARLKLVRLWRSIFFSLSLIVYL